MTASLCSTNKKAKTTALHPRRLPHLPHDIICSNILPRLPARTLLRFRCVCKLWNATIDDPTFIESHLIFSRKNSSRILGLYRLHPQLQLQLKASDPVVYNFVTKADYKFFSVKCPEDTKLIGHCNGLFCVVARRAFNICNPCTKEFIGRSLPSPPPPNHPNISYGFGFDSLTNEYKLVQIVHANHSFYRCKVYTLGAETSSWRKLEVTVNLADHFTQHSTVPEDIDIGITVNSGRAIHINGTLFWFFRAAHVLMSFDLHSEKFNFLEGPIPQPTFASFFDEPGCCGFLIELQGHLCLAFQNRDGDVVHLYKYNQLSASGWELQVLNLQHKSVFRVGSLGAESLLHSFTAKGIVAYPLEGLEGCHHHLIESKVAKLPLLQPKDYSIKEYGFSYHVENLVPLKSLTGNRPDKFKYHKC